MPDEPKAYKAKITDFRPDPRNLNRHTQRGRGMVEASQRQRGFGRPGFAAKDKTMLGGNLSILEVAADIDLGNGEIFVVETDGNIPIVHVRRDIEPGTEEAVLLAAEDNQSALISIDFDPVLLAEEIAQGIDFGGIFTGDEQTDILAGLNGYIPPLVNDEEPPIDRAEELRQEWGVELGQLWALGEHRVICGDCTDKGVVDRVMGGERAAMCFSDPPYNVSYTGQGQNTKVEIQNDDMTDRDFYEWLLTVCKSIDASLIEKGSVYLCHGDTGNRSLPFVQCYYDTGWVRSATIIWVKNSAPIGWQDYRPQHECISYGWKGGQGERFFTTDRTQTTLWEIARESANGYIHPTTKPVELPAKAIMNSSRKGSTVIDFFLGSAPTLIACQHLNRKCRGIEIDPGYVAVTLERFKTTFGIEPQLASNA